MVSLTSSTTMKPIEHRTANRTLASKATDHTGRPAGGRRRQSKLLVSADAQSDTGVLRLDRNRWPPVADHQSEAASQTSNISEISEKQPLIHTDQLNASSPLLTVLVPQNNSRLLFDKTMSESAFAPSRMATLVASYLPSQDTSTDPLEPAEGRRLTSVAPRLEVINLEVANTTATLTWSLALFPTQADAETTAHSARPSTDIDREPSSTRDERLDDGGEDKRAQVTSRSSVEQSTTTTPSLIDDEPFDSVHSDLLKADPPPPSKHLVTKRDTIRVRPTLNHQADTDWPASEETENEERVLQAAASVIEDMAKTSEFSGQPLDLQDLPVSKRMQLSRVQALPASNTRRPPARGQQQVRDVSRQQSGVETESVRLAGNSTTESSRLSQNLEPLRKPKSPNLARRRPKEMKPTTSSTTTMPAPTTSATTEPPMIRAPSVLITRITNRPALNASTSTTSSTTTTTTTTTSTTTTTTTTSTTTEAPPIASSTEPAPNVTTSNATPTEVENIVRSTTSNPLNLVSLVGSESSILDVKSTEPRAASTTTTKTPQPLREQPQTSTKSPRTSTTTPATITSTIKTNPPNSRARLSAQKSDEGRATIDSSRWLVRLRRFASNEVDIVKVVVNNLGRRGLSRPAVLRHIAFKNLEPASGYEICIESASPSQQVGDRFQIFDANHFLKCHDSSNVQLAVASNSTTTIRRMDMSSVRGEDPPEDAAKLKSLCKEFFTLPAGSSDRVNFGAAEQSTNGTVLAKNRPNLNETAGINPRRAKSLQGALSSRMELLEINDINSPSQPVLFEMAASRASSTGRLMPMDSQHNDNHLFVQPLGEPTSPSPRNDYLSVSALPIVGCVFALIFIVTLANIILNAISCRTSNRSRRAARANALIGSSGALGSPDAKRPLGSFYSDSDNSATSQSRIVVVGKHGQPFASSSAYFEVPVESSPLAGRLIGSDASHSSSNGSGGKRSSSCLLSNASAARFQLGPSFEGDAKHNADMVGLARKNYDNIINNIYNRGDELSSGPESLGAEQHSPVCSGKSGGSSKRSRCLAHARQGTKLRQLNSSELLDLRPNAEDTYATSAIISSDHQLSADRSDSRIKRQRIRFDKINPIYNMESLYAASSGGTRCRSPGNRVSSFGHLSSAKSEEILDGQRTVDEDCPLCTDTAASPSSGLAAEAAQSAPDGCTCDGDEDDDDAQTDCNTSMDPTTNSAYYTCCLDRQKQRFEKQQQQLEMVLTKNGSLIPQPFINPSGPSGPVTSCDPAIVKRGKESPSKDQPPDQPEFAAAKDDVTSYQFGESDIKLDKQTTSTLPANSTNTTSEHDIQDVSSKTLVPISVMATKQASEAMKRTDFDQRRNELASKLHLAGMIKP